MSEPLSYDEVALSYSDHYATPRDEAESRLIFGLARVSVGSGTLVDVGCGDGIALRYLGGSCDYIGVDPSQGMIAVARSRYPERDFRKGGLEQIPNGIADFVLGGFGPLIHIPDAHAFACEVRRVLWTSGTFLVMAATRGVVRATGVERVTHSAEELQDAFKAADLENVRVRGLRWLGRPLLSVWAPNRCEWLVVTGAKTAR